MGNASRNIAYGPEEDKKREACFLQHIVMQPLSVRETVGLLLTECLGHSACMRHCWSEIIMARQTDLVMSVFALKFVECVA